MYGEIHFQSLLVVLRFIERHRVRYEQEEELDGSGLQGRRNKERRFVDLGGD